MIIRSTSLKFLNPILAVVVFCQLLTGLFHGVLPRSAFELLHLWGGGLVAVCAVAHVGLNWNWVRATYLRRRGGSAPPPPTAAT